MAMGVEPDVVTATAGGEGAVAAAGVRQRRGWLKRVMTTTMPRRRGHYSPVGVELQGVAAGAAAEDVAADEATEKPRRRRRGWLHRLLVPGDYVHRQRRRWWKLQCGAVGGSSSSPSSSSRLAAGVSRSLRRRKPGSLSSSWATEMVDAVSFRVMYVVEAVVLGLALSCFFCCCGCQI